MSLPIALLLDTQTSKLFSYLRPSSPFSICTPLALSSSPEPLSFSPQTLTLSTFSRSSPTLFSPQYQYQQQEFNPNVEEEEEEHVIGDCVVFEEGIFEDPYVQQTYDSSVPSFPKKKKGSFKVEVEPEDLVPDKWKGVQAEINTTKKEKRTMAREMEFRYRVEKRKQELVPISGVRADAYVAYRSGKLLQLNPMVVHNTGIEKKGIGESRESGRSSCRVAPRDPRLAVYGGTLDDISEFFNSEHYDPESTKNNEGRHNKLLTREEKVLLNRRIPDLFSATSDKWQPLHSLTASGEFYLVDALLKHNVDINIQDKDGLTALHKAVISKKQAIFSYLLRESANPFVRDRDGATLMHYAVCTASDPMIKILLLYNVDINLQDNDGWTPLHLAVQTRRTDIVRLLLIKGADKTVKNRDGLTPLDICLYSGQDTRTYELIKLLKQLPKQR